MVPTMIDWMFFGTAIAGALVVWAALFACTVALAMIVFRFAQDLSLKWEKNRP
jgi:hypothetical protein